MKIQHCIIRNYSDFQNFFPPILFLIGPYTQLSPSSCMCFPPTIYSRFVYSLFYTLFAFDYIPFYVSSFYSPVQISLIIFNLLPSHFSLFSPQLSPSFHLIVTFLNVSFLSLHRIFVTSPKKPPILSYATTYFLHRLSSLFKIS